MEPKKILVIGGTGIIGCPVVNRLSKEDYRIYSVALDKIKFENDSINQRVVDRFSREFEIVMSEMLEEVKRFDAVVDICAFSGKSSRELVGHLNGKCDHLITMSTTLVYNRETKNDNPITETTALARKGSYGGYVDGKIELEEYYLEPKQENCKVPLF